MVGCDYGDQVDGATCKEPKMWGVPLVSWLPSLSIAINISAGVNRQGFIYKVRGLDFGVTALLLVLGTACFI